MANNVGYLTSDRTDDSLFSPFYIVDHIIKYLPKNKKIWCPFDIEEWSAFSVRLKEYGFDVISTQIDKGQTSLSTSLMSGILS